MIDTQENLRVVPAHPAYVGADLSSAVIRIKALYKRHFVFPCYIVLML